MNDSLNMVVGITQRVDVIECRNETRDALDQNLIRWLVRSGYIPVPVPNSLVTVNGTVPNLAQPILDHWLRSVLPAAVVLSGGNDIGEFPDRDTTEQYLLTWAESNRVPVLGICRGLQLMATWAGGTLTKIERHINTRHRLRVCDHTDQWPEEVNSFHNWALDACPSGFQVMARAENGVIEAIEHDELPWEGWMWHPEREDVYNPLDIQRLQALFRA